jgi:hypothetical protein
MSRKILPMKSGREYDSASPGAIKLDRPVRNLLLGDCQQPRHQRRCGVGNLHQRSDDVEINPEAALPVEWSYPFQYPICKLVFAAF